MMMGTPNPERVWKFIKIPKDPESCWQWLGATNSWGYGTFGFNIKQLSAHRFVYEYLMGKKVPKELILHHDCENKKCVNPEHLTPMSQLEHMSISDNHNRDKSQCKNGHKFSPENTRFDFNSNARVCKTCHNEWEKQRRLRKKLLVVAN